MATRSLAAFVSQPCTRSAVPFIKCSSPAKGCRYERLRYVLPISNLFRGEHDNVYLDRQIAQCAVVCARSRRTRKIGTLHNEQIEVTAYVCGIPRPASEQNELVR